MVLSKISPSSWSQSRKPIICWIGSVRERFLLILFCLFSSLHEGRNQTADDDEKVGVIPSLLRLYVLFLLLSKRRPFICLLLFVRSPRGLFLGSKLSIFLTFLAVTRNAKKLKNLQWLHIRKPARKKVRDAGSHSSKSWRVFLFSFYKTGLKSKREERENKKKGILYSPGFFFFAFSNLRCKRIKAWSRAVISFTQHEIERE